MKEAIKRICELQPAYSPDNTPEMQARGEWLRHVLKRDIEALQETLARCLGRFGDTFHVDASDGIGRKTELPWVRVSSAEMSPKPTEGFYVVLHFSTDGSAVHVTVGCGSSRFHNGSFARLPDRELDRQTSWARAVTIESFGTLSPFDDAPDFGAHRPLPKSFERATALSKRVAFQEIDETDFDELLAAASERLRAIYEAQSIGRDLSPADQAQLEVEEIIRPSRRKRQGYGLPAPARKAVEMRAMELAEEWLRSEGYQVTDTSASEPFDYLARKSDEVIKVEVKGTTSDQAEAILMTRNEVELHQSEMGYTALMIVTRIDLVNEAGTYHAAGGVIEVLKGWNIHEWVLEPTAFRCVRNS